MGYRNHEYVIVVYQQCANGVWPTLADHPMDKIKISRR